jgi:phosphohistidine phosphatase
MKQIFLIRHAKSSWNFPVNDINRPLINVGIQNAIKVALNSKQLLTDDFIIWSSPAKRAFETAKIFVTEWKLNFNYINIINELYTFDNVKLEKTIKTCPNYVKNLILFGHNNAITDFVNKFGDIIIDNVPTAGFVSITFETNNWSTINKGKTDNIIFPRQIEI